MTALVDYPVIVRCCGCGGWTWVQRPRKCLTCGAINFPPTLPLYPLDIPP